MSLRPALRIATVIIVLLLETAACSEAVPSKNSTTVNLVDLLQQARHGGLISDETSSQLLQLAANLTGTPLPPELSLPTNDKISSGSRRDGAEDDGANLDEGAGGGQRQPNLFMKFYNHLTLLNVLYFGGALLVMGAYTLFMTLAYENCHHGGLSGIMLVQVMAFGAAGITAWVHYSDFQFVGGLLCTISTSMVPFMVYNMHRAMRLWPDKDPGVFQGFQIWIRPSWIIMEIATIVCGLGYLRIVRFPFLLFPVSFSLWFLSMDLAPLYPRKTGLDFFEIRRRISVAFGMGMILLGFLMEQHLGSEPDLSFWVYLFGLMTFTGALQCTFPHDDLSGSILLLVNMGLILIGSHLDRTTFHVFGTIEMIVYTASYFGTIIKMSNSFTLWLLKALAAAALFSQALSREGNFEILCALVCVAAFNFNSIAFLGSANELYPLFLLLTNLGFVALAGAFSRPLDLWLFTLPDSLLPISLICSLMVAVFHVKILTRYFASVPTTLPAYAYLAYRVAASVAISYVFVFLRQANFAWIGGLGIPLVALVLYPSLRFLMDTRAVRGREHETIFRIAFTFLTLLFGVSFSIYLRSNVLYLICCVFMLTFVLSLMGKNKRLGCALAVALILLSVPLQSKFLITIGALYLFFYLSYLAYDVFKNSLWFPLALIGIGICLIYSGIMYQRHESELHSLFQELIPIPLRSLSSQSISSLWEEGGRFDWYQHVKSASFTWSNLVQAPYKWVFWSGAMTFALLHGSPSYVSYMCVGGIVALVCAYILLEVRESHKEHLDDKVKVTSLTFELSEDPAHEGHGMLIKVSGKKPSHLRRPVHIALDVQGVRFWSNVSSAYGEFAASMARSMFLPYKLTPHLISFDNFDRGSSQFSATIHLATGHKGTRRAKHTTISDAVRKLSSRGSAAADMTCVVLYSNAWYKPWSNLCIKSVSLTTIKRQLSSD